MSGFAQKKRRAFSDVWLAFGAVLAYCLLLALIVSDPFLGKGLCVIFAIPLLIATGLSLAFQLKFASADRGKRVVALCLIAGCLFSVWGGALSVCEAKYLARRVQLAGGFDAIEKWAQTVMDRSPVNEERILEKDEIPERIRSEFNGRVKAHREGITIHLGGGFLPEWLSITRQMDGPPLIRHGFD